MPLDFFFVSNFYWGYYSCEKLMKYELELAYYKIDITMTQSHELDHLWNQ